MKHVRNERNPISPLLQGTLGLVEMGNRIRKKPVKKYYNTTDANGNAIVVKTMDLIANRYKFVDKLGTGTFATIVKVLDTFTDRHVAIKMMNKKYSSIGQQEAVRIQSVNEKDKNGEFPVIRLMQVFEHYGHFCMVLELLSHCLIDRDMSRGIDVVVALKNALDMRDFDIFRKFQIRNVPKVAHLATQLMGGLVIFQKLGIIHADLKPENILFQNEAKIKIIDFGNCIQHDERHVYFEDYQVQTFIYRAPEVLMGVPFSYPIDMWSIGCILFEMLMGEPLFRCQQPNELIEQMHFLFGNFDSELYRHGKYVHDFHLPYKGDGNRNFERLLWYSGLRDAKAIDFFQKVLTLDYKQRLGPKQALFHPFLCTVFPFSVVFDEPKTNVEQEMIGQSTKGCKRKNSEQILQDAMDIVQKFNRLV